MYEMHPALSLKTGCDNLDMGGKSVDQKVYQSMIGSLLYLCASRSDIMLFSMHVCKVPGKS
jgi:hypothetical protein